MSLVNHETVYLLFSITRKRFNPALVGVFADPKVAAEAEKRLHTPHPDHTTSFILEVPVSHTVNDYEDYWRATLVRQVVEKVTKR